VIVGETGDDVAADARVGQDPADRRGQPDIAQPELIVIPSSSRMTANGIPGPPATVNMLLYYLPRPVYT
jgi:hypothetical protein